MGAICAACMRPLTTGERFSTSGTEIFHRACVKQLGTADSVSNRQRRQLAALEQKSFQTERALAELQQEAAKVGEILRRQREQLTAANDAAQSSLEARDALAQSNQDLRAERDRLKKELERTREDLALAHLPPPQPKGPLDTRDDTEIRFSLLEIEPPTKD